MQKPQKFLKYFSSILFFAFTNAFAQNIVKLEYFFNSDPGFGNGSDVPISSGTDLTKNFVADVSGLSEGFHILKVRAKDQNGVWSLAHSNSFYLQNLTLPSPNIVNLEYFFNSDPGFGNGSDVPISLGTDLTKTFVADVSGLSEGFHILKVRTKDQNGVWSLAYSNNFYLQNLTLPSPNISKLEYFFDFDPGFGNGIDVPISLGTDLTETFVADVGGLNEGFHILKVRAKDLNGNWSHFEPKIFFKSTDIPSSQIAKLEYFFNSDPGFGNGIDVPITQTQNVSTNFVADVSSLSEGFHILKVRAKDQNGVWSFLNSQSFFLQNPPAQPANIVELEYFFDTDPNFGSGTNLPLTPNSDVSVSHNFDVNTLSFGTHSLVLRGKDANGNWSHIFKDEFTYESPLAGTYTIDEIGVSDYNSFTEAINDLNSRGISDSVIFIVSPGLYSEAIELNEVPGASATNTITFRRTNPILASRLTPTPVGGNAISEPHKFCAIYFNGGDFFTFEGIDIHPLTATGRIGVVFENGATNNTIKNCYVQTPNALSSITVNAGIFCNGASDSLNLDNNYNTIQNVEIHNSYTGILWEGNSANEVGNKFTENEIHNFTVYGIDFFNQDSLEISQNEIHTSTSTTAFSRAIWCTGSSSGTSISVFRNKIYNLNGVDSDAIYFKNNALGKKLIYNNFIYDFNNSGETYGITIRAGSDGDEILHNSILIDNNSTAETYGIKIGTSSTSYPTNILLKNNIFYNANTGSNDYTILLYNNASFANFSDSDYNLLKSEGANLAKYNTINVPTLQDIQVGLVLEANSVSANPNFVSNTDLHITNSSPADNSGIQTNITTDFDGETRGIFPDIGADELRNSPSPITDFQVTQNLGTSASFSWTATGFEGNSGTASSYEIRYSTGPLTESNFASGTLALQIPTPSVAGTNETFSVSGLNSEFDYFWGIKAFNTLGYSSELATDSSFFDTPEITSILDVQNDNGGQVRITFEASENDTTQGTGVNVSSYLVLRKSEQVSSAKKSQNQISNQNFQQTKSKILNTNISGNWDTLTTLIAFGQQTYSVVVPTLADSNASGINFTKFAIQAQAYGINDFIRYSAIDSAYSVDNIFPPNPQNQNFANNGNGTTTVTWNSVSAPDLFSYKIYAELPDGNYDFVTETFPTSGTTESETFASNPLAVDYLVTSVDQNGNESFSFKNRITTLKVEAIENDILLSWQSEPTASVYKIYKSTNSDGSNPILIGSFNPTSNQPTFTEVGILNSTSKAFYFVTWE